MSNYKLPSAKSQAGFTLVELAIVMIIIGLLIAGVLKGQELIGNARVTSTVAQVQGIDGATSGFRDAYAAMPGDMITPQNRLPNCTNTPCSTAGDGDGRVDSGATAVNPSVAITGESLRFFTHLSAADLFSGVDQTNAGTAWGQAVPAAPVGGGFTATYYAGGTDTGAAGALRSGHYLTLRNAAATVMAANNSNAAVTPSQAARIDRKLDDGIANAGTTVGVGAATATGCSNAGAYNENVTSNECGLYIRFQQ